MNPSVLLLIGIVCAAGCIWSAKYILITALILPFIGAYLTARMTPSWSLVYYAAAGAFCFLFLGELWILAFLMILLSGVLAGIAVKKKISSYEAVILSCTGWILAVLAVIGYCHLKFETDPLTLIINKLRELLEKSDFAAVTGYFFLRFSEVLNAGSTTAGLLVYQDLMEVLWEGDMEFIRGFAMTDSAMNFYHNYAALVIPSFSMEVSLLGGLFSYLSARALCRKGGMEVAPIAKMKDFKVPVKITTPLALLYAAAVAATTFLNLSSTLQMIAFIVMDSLAVVFAVQAVTLIHWFISLRSKRRSTTVALSILIPLGAMLLGAKVLAWIGFFEMMFKLRYRVSARPTNPQ